MINYVKRNQLDIQKYDACIEAAYNSRIYAFSWYLDIVTDNWDALILNDYEAVMPLPWRSKYFIKYVYPPAWTQQLGVFSKSIISEELIKIFIKNIPRKFKKITIQFNSENKFQHKYITERVNYILPLDKSYEETYSEFNKNRKRVLKKTFTSKFVIQKEVSTSDFLKFYLNQPKNYDLNPNQLAVLKELLRVQRDEVNIWGVFLDKELQSCMVWLKNENRITYLLPVASQLGKEKGLPTFIISEVIKEYSNSNLQLDFEGSMLKSVANFYKSFGSEPEVYFNYQKNKF